MSKETFSDYYRVSSVLEAHTGFHSIQKDVLENAADRGSRVHAFCELYAKGMLFMEVDTDCVPYFESFKAWFDSVVEKVEFTEKRLFCDDLRITGQVDMLCYLKGDKHPTLIDLKTPQTASKTWRLQLAAYKYLLDVNDIAHSKAFILQLSKQSKTAKIHDFSKTESEDLIIFKKALDVHTYFNPL